MIWQILLGIVSVFFIIYAYGVMKRIYNSYYYVFPVIGVRRYRDPIEPWWSRDMFEVKLMGLQIIVGILMLSASIIGGEWLISGYLLLIALKLFQRGAVKYFQSRIHLYKRGQRQSIALFIAVIAILVFATWRHLYA